MNRHTNTAEYRPPIDPSRATRQRLRDAIARDLDPDDRLLIVLRYAEGMTHIEIGLVMGMAAEQVERRLDALESRLRAVA